MALDEPKDSDQTFDIEDLKFVVEKELLERTGAIKIDFASHPFGGGFRIEPENQLAAGGMNTCGSCSC